MRLIDADALSNDVNKSKHNNPHPNGMVRVNHRNEHDHFLRMISYTPTIDPESLRPQGEWIYKKYEDEDIWLYYCSECDTPNANKRNYCSNCGAKMKGADDHA